ncbi:hypothetical protein [Kitasatospora sp. NPDC004531]
MRAPEELHLVDWASLEHAYGSAEEVPEWIRALYDEDPAVAGEARGELFGSVMHQESVYPATVAAVPYLAHAAAHATHRRAELLAFLVGAGGSGRVPGTAEERAGAARVSAELPGLLHLLRDEDLAVRRQAVQVACRAEGAAVAVAVEALTACRHGDPSARVRADALTALGVLAPDAGERMRAALADPEPVIRATAALGLLETAGAPYPAELLAVLAEDGGDPAFAVSHELDFPGAGSTETRVRDVLDRDAEATRAIAAAWIAVGDHGERGSRRAVQLSEYWRDRETESVALLADALRRRRGADRRSYTMEALARWVVDCADPAQALEAARPFVLDADRWVSGAAQLVLGRAGDLRLLDLVPEPDPPALDALAARTGDPGLLRRALAPRPPCECCSEPKVTAHRVLAALTPQDAAPLLPELLALLRTSPHERLVRMLGGSGLDDPELLGVLGELAAGGDRMIGPAAAVAAARLGADPAPALRLLAERLARDGWALEDAALLGPVGLPLVPLVEGRLTDGYEWNRAHAAEALWRITGDPGRAVPVLAELLVPLPVGAFALATLRRIGEPLPAGAREVVADWAVSERRVLPGGAFWPEWQDNALRAEARLLLAQQG